MMREMFCQSCKGYVFTVGEIVSVSKGGPAENTTWRFACPLCRIGLDLVTKVSAPRRRSKQ